LAYLLKTEFVVTQLMRNNVGIAYPAIDESCLSDVLLPVRREELPKLRQQAAAISVLEERLYRMRKQFRESIENAGAAWRQMSLKPDSRPHPTTQTISCRQSRKSDSDSHAQDIFSLVGGRRV